MVVGGGALSGIAVRSPDVNTGSRFPWFRCKLLIAKEYN